MTTLPIHVITDHDTHGNSIIVTDAVVDPPTKHETPFGTISYLYANPAIPSSLTHAGADADLKHTQHCRLLNSLPNGRVTPDGGLAVVLTSLKPGASSPMHRTRTLDLGIVLEGEVEMELDGGVKRVLRAGDTVVQRGTVHRWRNVSEGDGWVRMYFVAVDARPVLVKGKELEEEWRD